MAASLAPPVKVVAPFLCVGLLYLGDYTDAR